MQDAGTGGFPPGTAGEPTADAEERDRAAALRARIAILAAGSDAMDDPGFPGRTDNLDAAAARAVRDVLPGLLRDQIRSAVTEVLPVVLGPLLRETVREQSEALYRREVAPRFVALEQALDTVAARAGTDPAGSPARDALVEEIDALRADVANALEFVQQRLEEQAQLGFARVKTDLEAAITSVSAEIRSSQDALVHDGGVLRATLTALADEQLAVLESSADRTVGDLAELADGVRSEFDELAAAMRNEIAAMTAAARRDVRGVTRDVHVELDAMSTGLRSSVERELFGAINEARQISAASTQNAVEKGIGQLQAVLAANEQERAADRSELALFSDRLAKAGRALLDHLAARDLLLEQARDELVGQLLTELTAGMSERDRTAASRRLAAIAQRHRDGRDAARWRSGRSASPEFPSADATGLDPLDEDRVLGLVDGVELAQPVVPPSVFEPAGVTSAPLVGVESDGPVEPSAEVSEREGQADEAGGFDELHQAPSQRKPNPTPDGRSPVPPPSV